MRQPSGNLHSGIVAGAAPGASLTTLYTAGKRGAENLSLYVTNIAAAAKTFRVQVVNAAGTVTRYLCFDAAIGANSLPIVLDIPSLRMSDVVKVYGSDNNVEFVLFATTYE